MAHLFHFCAVLPRQASYGSECRPSFKFESGEDEKFFRATVVLPSCIDPAVRMAQGKQFWLTERAAMKDAAFESYKALYEFGLVNDNLLPRSMKRELRKYTGDEVHLPAIVETRKRWDPWVDMAHEWSTSSCHYQTPIEVKVNGIVDEELAMVMTTPIRMAGIEPIDLFWDSGTTFTVSFGDPVETPVLTSAIMTYMRKITSLYLRGPPSKNQDSSDDFVTLITPRIPMDQLGPWLDVNGGTHPALEVYASGQDPKSLGVVRDRAQGGKRYIFKDWTYMQLEEDGPQVLMMNLRDMPKRRNLLERQTLARPRDDHSIPNRDSRRSRYLGNTIYAPRAQLIPAERCTIDQLPVKKARFGILIPSVMYVLEMTTIATRLRDTVLKDVGFESVGHIITAITAPAAQGLADYQRYEFFGDTLLKFTASCRLFVENPHWHEGYLTETRDNIVKNRRLAGASLSLDLDKIITTEMNSPRRWKPLMISTKTEQDPEDRRNLSRKVLADVIEALIGAGYFYAGQGEAGHAMARKCIYALLPEINSERADFSTLPRARKSTVSHDERLLEQIGYRFKDQTLLTEALTHPSCEYDLETQSYQRLEFLGDSVLDMVLISTIAQHPADIQPGRMTRMKHALVSANLLAFLCMEFGFMREDTFPVAPTAPATTKEQERNPVAEGVEMKTVQRKISLWRFLRFQEKSQLRIARTESVKRYSLMADEIRHALNHDMRFPWEALARVSADKLFSDVIESVLGAIYMDSNGDLSACRDFVERIGLMHLVRRYLNEPIELDNPVYLVQRVAHSQKIQYIFQKEKTVDSDADLDKTGGQNMNIDSYQWVSVGSPYSYTCTAEVCGVPVATARDCLTKEEAHVKAAYQAIQEISANGFETYVKLDANAGTKADAVEGEREPKDEGEGKDEDNDESSSDDDDMLDAYADARPDLDDDDVNVSDDEGGSANATDWQDTVSAAADAEAQDPVAQAVDEQNAVVQEAIDQNSSLPF